MGGCLNSVYEYLMGLYGGSKVSYFSRIKIKWLTEPLSDSLLSHFCIPILFLLPYENLPLSFVSGGYIDRNFKGRILIKLTNYSTKKVKLNSGTCIGYIVMQPYSLE